MADIEAASDSSESGKQENVAPIGEELQLFRRHIQSLQDTLPNMMFLLQEVGKHFKSDLESFEKQYCEVEEQEHQRKVTVPGEQYRAWYKRSQRNDRYLLARTLVPRSILVALVSQYDAFIGRLLRAIFILRPDTLNVSEKQISFSQLMSFPNVEAAREFVIEKEVEAVLRSSHADQFKWMEQRFGLTLTKGLAVWPEFIELTERRNLFVHTDGAVSRQYLAVCRDNKSNLAHDVREGKTLRVPPEYFKRSCEVIHEIGVKLAHVLWRKLLPDDRKAADSNLVEVSYQLVDGGQYSVACAVLDFVCESFRKFSSEWSELALTINRAQAHKWLGKNDVALEVLKAVDWSAKGDEFKLANAVLIEKWEEAAQIMKRIGANGPVEKADYRDWPMFRVFRTRPEFKTAYKEVFGTEFKIESTTELKASAAEPAAAQAPDGSPLH